MPLLAPVMATTLPSIPFMADSCSNLTVVRLRLLLADNCPVARVRQEADACSCLALDAAANRERIVVAARAALGGSNGAIEELSLHLVAKAAGVGQGTLYRHFPSREHLLSEVYRQELGELADAVPALLADHRPLDALTRWLERLIDYARVKRGVMAAIEASAWRELYTGHHGRLDEALTELLDRGNRRRGAGRHGRHRRHPAARRAVPGPG